MLILFIRLWKACKAHAEQCPVRLPTQQCESIAGKYAMTGLLSLMNAGEEDVNKLRTAIEECDGAASSMADTMQNNTAGVVTVMKSALEGLGIAIYDKFGEQLRDRINGLTDVFSGLTERIDAGEFDEVFERVANSVGNAADQLIEFAKTGLPAAIEGLADLISVLVEYRGVIAGVVTGMVAFKTNMAIAKTITGLVGAIKGIVTAANAARTATQALTAAQAANNLVAAANPYIAVASAVLGLSGGIAMLIGVTNSATDSMSDAAESADDLKRKTDELNQTAKEADQAAQAVSDLAEEYRDIKEASDDTKEAKERLKEIQDILIDTYGVEAEKIDLVNGKYEEQLGTLQQVVDEKNEAARMAVNAAYYNQRDAITKGYTIDISGSGLTFENDVDRDVFQKSLDDRGIPAKLSDDGKSLIFNSGVSYKQAEQYLIDWGHDLEAGAFAGTGTGLYSWVANAALAANQAAADYDNVPPLGFNYMKMNLADVLYDPRSGDLITPNTGVIQRTYGSDGIPAAVVEERARHWTKGAHGYFTGSWSDGVSGGSGVDKSGKSGIMNTGSDRVTISSIDNPIEQQHTGKGNPNAILIADVSLNNRQQQLLDKLPGYDSRVTVPRESVNMADLSALTAKTGDEFAMFTKGGERLVIRGNYAKVNIEIEEAQQLAAQGYKWSGHTHPGTGINVLMPSGGDKRILMCFEQEISVIYNSKGNFATFGKE